MGLVNISLHLIDFYGKLVGKYTVRPMDPMGNDRIGPPYMNLLSTKCWYDYLAALISTVNRKNIQKIRCQEIDHTEFSGFYHPCISLQLFWFVFCTWPSWVNEVSPRSHNQWCMAHLLVGDVFGENARAGWVVICEQWKNIIYLLLPIVLAG